MKKDLVKKYYNQSNKVFGSILMIGIMILLVGFSYAFFVYNKTGLYTHTITGGKMSIIYNETTGNNITIDNAYPLTDEEALTKGLEFEFTITGYNESDKNIYYAIEMDYGEDVSDKERFLDSDLKLTFLENDEEVFENEIFNNLDNQDIHYGMISSGTSSESPVTNNYKLRIWINDYVIISDTLSDDLSTWSEADFMWLYNNYPNIVDRIFTDLDNGVEIISLSNYGMSIYKTEEFANRYTNFKVNVKADLTYDDVGFITYDANGGSFTPKKTSLTTNMITMQKPVIENKGFLGWSSDKSATIPEYKSGQYYSGDGKILYAVYSDKINVMTDLSLFNEYKSSITELYFVDEKEESINEKYESATIKFDLTDSNYITKGKVLGWLEEDVENPDFYKAYIASDGVTYLINGRKLFVNWMNLLKIDFSNLDTSMVTDMSYMFGGCYDEFDELESWTPYMINELNLEGFNTSNVLNMSYMFSSLWNMLELDVSSFDTSKVTSFKSMFANMSSFGDGVLALDLSHFNTSQVTDMSYMFDGFGSIQSLNLNSFDTTNVTTMRSMFSGMGCYGDCVGVGIEYLDLSHFNTSKVTDMSYMFRSTSDLVELNISNFDTSQVTDMSYMFANCGLESMDLTNFDTNNVTNMSNMFYECLRLTSLDVSSFNTSNVMDMSSMFSECKSLLNFDLSNFNTSQVTDMNHMFYNCYKVQELDLKNFNTSNVENMSEMFSFYISYYNNSSLKYLNISHFNTENVENMYSMFDGCNKLESIDISHFNTAKVTNMSRMFYGCSILSEINFGNIDTSSVTDMSDMFGSCTNLQSIDVSHFNTSKVTDMTRMFYGCSSLKTIYCNNDWSTGIISSSVAMFLDCPSLVGAVSYDSTKRDITMANPDTGYFTRIPV